ncbi:MAG: hypothetical protein IPK22_24495 [Verrucomicrobiaceae bacterium]|nr:hypothetical protein [Verrucomicrobiaceae bacterium]
MHASPPPAEDMTKYLKETQEMVRAGKHEEALKRFVWFHEHALEYEPAMSGVRRSFALGFWKKLGEAYPPALEAMIAIRDADEQLLREGKGSSSLFHDLFALNSTLEEEKKTLELFEVIQAVDPQKAKTYWIIVKHMVLALKRYDLAKLFIPDAEAEFDRVKSRFVALYDRSKTGAEKVRDFLEGHFVQEVRDLVEFALATGNREVALTIRDKALTVLDDDRLRLEIAPPDLG